MKENIEKLQTLIKATERGFEWSIYEELNDVHGDAVQFLKDNPKKSVLELGPNEVIHCPTKEQANAICKLMHEAGKRWVSKMSYLDRNNWRQHLSRTCYDPYLGEYCDFEFYKRQGYTIHPATDFL